MCHCEGTCARGNLQCALAHKTKIEEKFTPEIPTPVCELARNDTILRLYGLMQNAKLCVILSERQRVEESAHFVFACSKYYCEGPSTSLRTTAFVHIYYMVSVLIR